MGPLIFTERARSFKNLIIGGECNIEGEFLACQLYSRSARKTEKIASAQGGLKFRAVSNHRLKRKGIRNRTREAGKRVLGVLFVFNDFLPFLICLQLKVRGHWYSTMPVLCLSALLQFELST